MDNQTALIILNLLPGLGPVGIGNLIDKLGEPRAILETSERELRQISGLRKSVLESIIHWEKIVDIERELALIKEKGIRIITIIDDEYPFYLKNIHSPPTVLYIKTSSPFEVIPSIAIVGTRKASPYGEKITKELSMELSMRGFIIVSGMARGIDSIAHKAALDAGGRTVAVLGCGVDVVYPKENEELAEQIQEQGAIISEFGMGTSPSRENFPRRNRIISGLCLGVVVTEASARSGSLITTRFALEQGREVFSVPGKINAQNSEGVNGLIKHGAKLVQNVEDILSELQPTMHTNKITSKKTRENVTLKPASLSPEEKKIYDTLSDEPIHIDKIMDKTQFSIGAMSQILLTLELKKIIKQIPGKMFIRM